MIEAIFGCGGLGREIFLSMIRTKNQIYGNEFEDPIFFVDDEYLEESIRLNRLYTIKPLSEFDPSVYILIIALGDSKKRYDVVNRLPKETKYFSVINSDIEYGISFLGGGSYIARNCSFGYNVNIGSHSIISTGTVIGHDSEIGAFFSSMPQAVISGNVNIGYRVYLGCNSSIKEKTTITDDVVVGMGSVVLKDIKEPGTYVGVPVRKLL